MLKGSPIGADGYTLLAAVCAPDAPVWLRQVSGVDVPRRIWVQNFSREGERTFWRTDERGIPPAATFLSSPHDSDAHYGKKGTPQWVGYKVHLTETCEEDVPLLITNVETTPGPVADGDMTPTSHQTLARKHRLPQIHLVDTGYMPIGVENGTHPAPDSTAHLDGVPLRRCASPRCRAKP